LRVLDFTRILSGPYCTQFLSELGAEVIKVERPGVGDDTRAWGPPFIDHADHTSAYYAALNRGKRSITIDITNTDGQELVHELVRHCDVVIENFRPGVAERNGLDGPTLHAVNPRIVSCSISGFGRTGELASHGGTEVVVEAMSGMMSVTGPPQGEPARFGIAMTDIATGLTAAARILAAVLHARTTGVGGHVELSLYGTALGALGTLIATTSLTGVTPPRWGSHHPSIVPYGGFPTSDGHVIAGVINDASWQTFCDTVGCHTLADDTRLATNGARVRAREHIESTIATHTRQRTTADLVAALRAKGLLAAAIRTVDEVIADPATLQSGLVTRVADHPQMLVSRISGSPAHASPEVLADLGQDTEGVLKQILGLSDAAIGRLHQNGALGPASEKPKSPANV
jgi:crotonobetainyl-CoA:carnitine CoA-transferase CaiB-like acyl-CoA transferase